MKMDALVFFPILYRLQHYVYYRQTIWVQTVVWGPHKRNDINKDFLLLIMLIELGAKNYVSDWQKRKNICRKKCKYIIGLTEKFQNYILLLPWAMRIISSYESWTHYLNSALVYSSVRWSYNSTYYIGLLWVLPIQMRKLRQKQTNLINTRIHTHPRHVLWCHQVAKFAWVYCHN